MRSAPCIHAQRRGNGEDASRGRRVKPLGHTMRRARRGRARRARPGRLIRFGAGTKGRPHVALVRGQEGDEAGVEIAQVPGEGSARAIAGGYLTPRGGRRYDFARLSAAIRS
jgi:hypothetical protein